MVRKIYNTWLMALLLCFSIGASADNVVSLSSESGEPGSEVIVTVNMTNTDAVSMLQLSVPLDENLTFVQNSAVPGSRLNNLSVTAGTKEGVLNIVVFSQNMSLIGSGSGELLTFRLKLGDVPTDIALVPSKLLLVGSDGLELQGTTESGNVSIRCAKAQYSTMTVDFGAVPIRSGYGRTVTVNNVGNEPLIITDINFSDATFSTTTPMPLTVNAGQSASLNVSYAPVVRGNVETQMKVVCNSISKLNTIQLLAQPFAVNELHVGNVSGVSDEEVTIPLTMNNMDDIVGFQLEFDLPDALEYVDGSFELSDRKVDHQATVSLRDKKLTIIAVSNTGKAFKDNDGVVGSFAVKLVGRYGVTLRPSKDILTAVLDGESVNVLSADYGGQVSIQSPRISASNTLDFGERPITGAVEQTYTINNYGSAPLTISRIVFSDERFSVKETLPLVIDRGNNATITIVNSDLTEGSLSGTMNIYSNDPDQRLLTADITGRMIVPNHLAFAAEAYSGEDVALTIDLDNYNPITGIQLDITSTDKYTVDKSKVKLAARAKGLELTIQQMDETTWRLVGYKLTGNIASGSGKLLTIYLTPNVAFTAGTTHQLTISKMMLGDSDLTNKYEGQAQQAVSFTVQEAQAFKPGDANGDQTVDVMDVVLTVDYILNRQPANFIFKAADMNHDGVIDVSDVVGIVNVILNTN